jgi:hypothetical protein
VPANTNEYEPWLRYALGGLADEYERVALRVRTLNRLTVRAQSHVQLNRRQETILTALTSGEAQSLSRADVESLTGAAERTAREDLKGLISAGVLTRVAGGRYRLPKRRTGAGRPTFWTDERVEQELRALIASYGEFPTATILQRDHRALSQAIYRSGGVRSWRRRLGG